MKYLVVKIDKDGYLKVSGELLTDTELYEYEKKEGEIVVKVYC